MADHQWKTVEEVIAEARTYYKTTDAEFDGGMQEHSRVCGKCGAEKSVVGEFSTRQYRVRNVCKRCEPCVVYWLFDENEVLLYVGMTHDLPRRLSGHRSLAIDGGWFRAVQRVRTQAFPTRVAAEEAERQAIIDQKPLYNLVENSGRLDQLKRFRSVLASAINKGNNSLMDIVTALHDALVKVGGAR